MTYKPYEQVLAVYFSHGDIRLTCYGQIISQQIPNIMPVREPTYKVRLVPDDPTTMVELPADMLYPCNKKRWVQYARVSHPAKYPGLFPLDMLRYDYCAPVSFDLVVPTDPNTNVTTVFKDEYQEFIVGRATETAGRTRNQWTIDRWRSFGWNCHPLKALKIENK